MISNAEKRSFGFWKNAVQEQDGHSFLSGTTCKIAGSPSRVTHEANDSLRLGVAMADVPDMQFKELSILRHR